MFNHENASHPDDTLGGRISLAREAAGLSEGEAAERLGVLSSSWNAWECDRDVPRANRLAMMAGVLGVTPSWLLTGHGSGPAQPETNATPADLQRALHQASEDMAALNRRMRELAAQLGPQGSSART